MRKSNKQSFKELVNSNKQELLKDQEAMERLEIKLENRHLKNR